MTINNEERRKFKEVLDEVLKRFDEKETESIKLYDKPTITMDFSDALRELKDRKKITRKDWNEKGMFVVYVDGVNNNTIHNNISAFDLGLNIGERYVVNPYLQIKCVDGSYSIWTPSTADLLADDWFVVS